MATPPLRSDAPEPSPTLPPVEKLVSIAPDASELSATPELDERVRRAQQVADLLKKAELQKR